MTTNVFPSLPGRAWPFKRTVLWQTRLQYGLSGRYTTQADWKAPLYVWSLDHNVLRQGTVNGISQNEFAQLLAFYNNLNGALQSFLFQDPDDNSVTAQAIGTTDGATTTWQLVRTLGGQSEPIQAPNLGATVTVFLNGVSQSPASYTVTPWGTSNTAGPGKLIFNSAPATGKAITMTYSWYYPCRFLVDQCVFQNEYLGYISIKDLQFQMIRV